MSDRRALQVLLGVSALVVLVGAGAIGFVFGNAGGEEAPPPPTGKVQGAIPAHRGANLAASSIGDPRRGQQLFTSMGCSSCHSYGGNGGTDAPPLDFMKGQLSASEIADMSGVIWNHVPGMLPHFKEEGIHFPTFKDNQMADLIAYLHSGHPAGKAAPATKGMKQMQGMKQKQGMKSTTGGGASGQQLFTTSCGSCHTLAAAGTAGTVGPNLDDLKPSERVVLSAITSGPGAMPSALYSGAEAQAVAKYVAQNAGK